MVRGYWGDIVNSPYMGFGNEVNDEDDRKCFYRQCNYQTIYSNISLRSSIGLSTLLKDSSMPLVKRGIVK